MSGARLERRIIPVAENATARSSTARSSTVSLLDENAVTLAVAASVRHEDTDYDELLMTGVGRQDARVRSRIDEVLEGRRP